MEVWVEQDVGWEEALKLEVPLMCAWLFNRNCFLLWGCAYQQPLSSWGSPHPTPILLSSPGNFRQND